MACLIPSEDVLELLEEQVSKQTVEVISRGEGLINSEEIDINNIPDDDDVESSILAEIQKDNNKGLGDADLDRMMGEKVRFESEIEEFLRGLYEEVYDRNVDALRKLYETDYPTLSERYFSDRRWPSIELVERFYQQFNRYHQLIITLYKELYFRHLFLKCQNDITWDDRKLAWDNYSRLLTYLAEVESKPDEGKSLCLPIQWIWDMLDEFVFQYHEACRWRVKMIKKMSDDDKEKNIILKELENESDIWRSSHVFEYLHSLVYQTDIYNLIKCIKEDNSKLKLHENEIRYQLGYFSMLLLLKLYVLIGDYYGGMRIVEEIEISTRSLYWKVPAAHLSFFYHLGFAYMMLRRYNDAIRVMSQILIYVSRQRIYFSTQSYQLAAINRTIDRMYALVMLCSSVCNIKLDESVNQTVKEKYIDKYYKLQQDNDEAYRDIFHWACPKFINPSMFVYENKQSVDMYANSHTEVYIRQAKMFLKEVENHKKIATINSFAKLYNNIQLSKLSSLMEFGDKEDSVRSEIMSVKYKTKQKLWRYGNLLNGEIMNNNIYNNTSNANNATAVGSGGNAGTSSATATSSGGNATTSTGATTSSVSSNLDNLVDFFVNINTIHVRSQSTEKLYIDQFLKQLERSQMLINTIQKNSSNATNINSNNISINTVNTSNNLIVNNINNVHINNNINASNQNNLSNYDNVYNNNNNSSVNYRNKYPNYKYNQNFNNNDVDFKRNTDINSENGNSSLQQTAF